MKKSVKLPSLVIAAALLFQMPAFAEYEWAKNAVNYCVEKKILSGMENGDLALGDNLTREQMAKIMVDAFGLTADEYSDFSDVFNDRWSYAYIQAFHKYMKKSGSNFKPDENVSRQEFAASLVLSSGLKESNLRNPDILSVNFSDYNQVDSDYKKLLSIAVERGYYKGSDGMLRPADLLTRAEACSLLYRVLGAKEGKITLDLGVKQSSTPICGAAQISVGQAKAWAKKSGAAERFIDIADIYWKYGEITGIRPEILYAQAAKETGYGKYGGNVLPEQNNWAGIKVKGATGDRTEDHETFETPDDGVRAHFNHMSAYIGLEPVGTPHGRYYSVKTLKWAGSVKTVEELGGKWCPDLYYGYSILHNYLEKM
ncbi:MAG: S-layer homology domain-containing protein [Firmicutes bacterium]|nr:S-layer homology domain-containing protein [Bacillota bacterium]